MLLLLALPIVVGVAAIHRYLTAVAPTNVLVRRVRAQEPRWRTAAMLAVFALGCLVIMHVVAGAVASGAPGWLNLMVLVLAWDAIKLAVLALLSAGRCIIHSIGRGRRGLPLAS